MTTRWARLPRFVAPLLLALLALLAPIAAAGPSTDPFPMPGIGGEEEDSKISATHELSTASVAPGDRIVVAVIMKFAPGWHAWPAIEQDVLEPALAASVESVRTKIGLPFDEEGNRTAAPAWLASLGPIKWPEPHPADVSNPEGNPPTIKAMCYEGTAIAFVPLGIAADAPAGPVSLTLVASLQACDDQQCLRPQDFELPISLTIDPAAVAATPTTGAFAGLNWSALPAPAPIAAPPITDAQASTDPATPIERTPIHTRTFFGIPIPSALSPVGIAIIALLSMLGGAVLNLTPCVLPVIPIKVMTLTTHSSKSRARTLTLGLWMALGVVAFWLGIGIPAAFVAKFADPSRIFGIWWLTLGIGLLIAAMGFGIMGFFSINLPAKVYAINPRADTAHGSFLFGVMTGVLGLPCFGFVAGALLAAAANWPPLVTVVIFTAIGIGMALPYLVLSIWPALLKSVPRTGPASDLVKQVMGLLLMAAGAFFIGSGLIAAVAAMPYLGRQLHWWVVALLASAAGLWLIIRTFQITSKPGKRLAFTVIGLILGGAAVLFAAGSTNSARKDYIVTQAALATRGDGSMLVRGAWMPYSEAALDRALDEGNVVFLDFTAEWCTNCKFLKATVLGFDPAKSAILADDRVIAMTVDLTADRAPGWKLFDTLGQRGIPQWAVFGPGIPDRARPLMTDTFTPADVLSMIRRAKGDQAATSPAETRPALD